MSDVAFDLIDALQSPVLTHDISWADCIPKRILDVIPMARMASLMKKEELATYPEVCAFLITRAMIAPMTSEWTDIYCHVSCKVCEEYFHEDHWEKINAKRQLSNYDNLYSLLPLRQHIYNKRRDILKQRMKENKPAPNCKLENIVKKDLITEYKQLEILFQ
jgi:hypothetical protein